ncbi:MAG: hypothetical protein M1817_005377 [Caeruleum heppii]|nr:MAG: hypothetical protein M1817_005377 [Caeruleum heppii]
MPTKVPPRTPRKELSVQKRAEIIGAHKAGVSRREIARKFDLPRSTVGDTIRLQSARVENRSQRRGRPRKTTDADDDHLERAALADPARSIRSLQEDTSLSRTTVKRRLKERSITKGLAAPRGLVFSSRRVARPKSTKEKSSLINTKIRKGDIVDTLGTRR